MEVKPGHAIAIRSPSPAEFLIICLWSPWPKAPSSVTATVPQTIPNTVRSVRSFWLRMSRNICRSASLKLSMLFAGRRVRGADRETERRGDRQKGRPFGLRHPVPQSLGPPIHPHHEIFLGGRAFDRRRSLRERRSRVSKPGLRSSRDLLGRPLNNFVSFLHA